MNVNGFKKQLFERDDNKYVEDYQGVLNIINDYNDGNIHRPEDAFKNLDDEGYWMHSNLYDTDDEYRDACDEFYDKIVLAAQESGEYDETSRGELDIDATIEAIDEEELGTLWERYANESTMEEYLDNIIENVSGEVEYTTPQESEPTWSGEESEYDQVQQVQNVSIEDEEEETLGEDEQQFVNNLSNLMTNMNQQEIRQRMRVKSQILDLIREYVDEHGSYTSYLYDQYENMCQHIRDEAYESGDFNRYEDDEIDWEATRENIYQINDYELVDRHVHQVDIMDFLKKIEEICDKKVNVDAEEPETTGEEFDEGYLYETIYKSKYKKGQQFIDKTTNKLWEITRIEFQPSMGFFYDITNKNNQTSFGDSYNLTYFVPEQKLETNYYVADNVEEPELSGEEFDECLTEATMGCATFNNGKISIPVKVHDIDWDLGDISDYDSEEEYLEMEEEMRQKTSFIERYDIEISEIKSQLSGLEDDDIIQTIFEILSMEIEYTLHNEYNFATYSWDFTMLCPAEKVLVLVKKKLSDNNTSEPETTGEEFDECVLKENFYDYLSQYASRDETMTQRAVNIIRQIPTHKMFKLVWNPEDYGANVEKTYNIEKIVEMYVDYEFGKSGEETEYFFEKLKNLNSNEHFQWSGYPTMSNWDIDFSVVQGPTDSVPASAPVSVYSRSYMEEKYGFIHGWDSTALINVAINVYDIDWDTDDEDENLPTEISEYFGLGESDMNFFAQQMSSYGYLGADEIEEYMGDYADDLISRFPYSTNGFSYRILNIKEVKDMITRYVQNTTEEPSEPETTGEEFDECALNEEIQHIINLSKI
jgi:hypothetical protein